jgi:septal ring factor EnvC (AmiA/AmiB activator)
MIVRTETPDIHNQPQQSQFIANMIDTLKYCKEFKKAGFDDKQAEILTNKLCETTEHAVMAFRQEEQLTKHDIKLIEQDIKRMDQNIKRMDQDIKQIEQNIIELKIEVVEVKVLIERTKSSALYWILTMMFGQSALTIGAVIAAIKWL